MPKYCPKCGEKIGYEDAAFCESCGFKLSEKKVEEKQIVDDVETDNDINIESELLEDEEPVTNLNFTDLGRKLEEAVEQILQAQGYKTQRNLRTETSTGSREVDILARKKIKGKEIVKAVECKNWTNPVDLKHIVYFCDLLEKKEYKIGLFVTTSYFTEQASNQAKLKGIETWTFEDVKEQLALASIGRLKGQKSIKKEYFKYALPVKVSFEEVSKINISNPEKVSVLSADLVWRPYDKVFYRLSANCYTPDRKVHKIKNEGYVIIDALGGGVVRGVISTELEKEPKRDYECIQEGKYRIKKITPNIKRRDIIRSALFEIRERNSKKIPYKIRVKKRRKRLPIDYGERKGLVFKDMGYETIERTVTKQYSFEPRYKDIFIKNVQLVYVPRWEVTFASGEHTYSRKIFANSNTKMVDHISICPEHKTRERLKFSSKRTVAVCEVCGLALCSNHINKCPVCKKWFCLEHSESCVDCKKVFCKEDIDSYCEICHKPLCEECANTCPICGKKYCKKHTVVCDNCHDTVCVECTTSFREKLVFKKYICKNCRE